MLSGGYPIAYSQNIPQPFDTESKTAFVIWQGFEHQWSFNHRMSRLGDAISYFKAEENPQTNGKRLEIQHFHSAGHDGKADKMAFESKRAIITARGIKTYTDSVVFRLANKEGKKQTQDVTIKIPSRNLLASQENYPAIINGFELISNEKADPVEELNIYIGDGYFDKDTVYIDISVGLRANCKGLGCGCKNKYDYTLKIYYLVLCGDNQVMAQNSTLSRRYFWDRREEPQNTFENVEIEGDTSQYYSSGIPAFKKINFLFDKPFKFSRWNIALKNTIYNPQTKICTFKPDFFFQQWNKKNFDSDISGSFTKKSKRKLGFYIVNCDISLLQFKNSKVIFETHEGVEKMEINTTSKYVKSIISKSIN